MKILLTGPMDGNILDFYKDKSADWVMSTGSMGIWPDPARIDKGTRKHAGPGDFSLLYVKNEELPIPTLFVEGAHDDHEWLNRRKVEGKLDIIPNLTYLVNGNKTLIGDATCEVSIVGLGKVYSFDTLNGLKTKNAIRHYTAKDIEKAMSHKTADILLLHQAPLSYSIVHLVNALKPKLVLHTGTNGIYNLVGTKVLRLSLGSAIMLKVNGTKFNLSTNP
jgi:hypothetical protein